MKVTIIGAESTYTLELVEGFHKNKHLLYLPILCLMDIDTHSSCCVINADPR